jgi:hypothetical protein
MIKPNTLTVTYKCIDDAHVFISTDGLTRGVCAASNNFREAFNEVPLQFAKRSDLDGNLISWARESMPTHKELRWA